MKPKSEPEIDELGKFLSIFNNESDRGAALTAASYLDQRIYEILEAFFANVSSSKKLLSGFNAPLGTLSSRTNAALSLGLIQQNEFDEVNTIRKIRNEFAHSWKDITFESQKIKDYCNNLPWLGPKELEETSNSRSRFDFAVSVLLIDLLWRVRLVKKDRRQLKNWPNKSYT